MNDRDSWRSAAGFVLALMGSAVGLGNLWRFAYTASSGGEHVLILRPVARHRRADAVVRLDVSRGLGEGRRWRLDFYLEPR